MTQAQPKTAIGRGIELPPEQFYWAVLDASTISLRGRRVSKRQLGYLFEVVLPLPIEQVHATYHKYDGALQYVACGMQRQQLERWMDAQPQEAISLAPAALPEFVRQQIGASASDTDTSEFNLLIDEFEPLRVRRLRRRWVASALAAVLTLSLLIVIGLERRVSALAEQTTAMHVARNDAIAHVLNLNPSTQSVNPDLLLTAELRTLSQTRSQPTPPGFIETDCSMTLASLLARWPNDLHLQTESIIVAPTAITFRGAAPTSSVIQSLADSLQQVEGWSVQQPQINASRDMVQATIQLKPSGPTLQAIREGGQS